MARPNWWDELYGAGETGLGLLSSAVAEPAAGWAGILSGDPGAVGAVREGLTYEPRSETGRRNMRAIGEGVGALMDYEAPLSPTGLSLGEELGALASGYNDELVPALQGVLGDEAGAGVGALGAGIMGTVGGPARAGGRSTIRGAQRKAYPGVYKSPAELERDVVVAPEDPIMRRLWGVTRADLADMSKRKGNTPGVIPSAPKKLRGSAAARPIMKPANTARLVEGLDYFKDTPLGEGMLGWYVMDPMYRRMEELFGPDEARRRYTQLNTLSGQASPGSDVLTEINRGSAANMLQEQGRFNDFMKYGGGTEPGRPSDMAAVQGHAYHRTAQGEPMRQFLQQGALQMKSPKVPLYIQASGVPQTGFQTDFPVGDAHWSRAVGLADTRTNANPGASYSVPEAMSLRDWWRDDVAGAAGLEAVPGQALAWGAYSPQTGVKTPVGAPKLELWSQQIQRAADRLGISPEDARDQILAGKQHAGFVDPRMLRWLATLGAGGYVASGMLEDDVEESDVADRFRRRIVE